MLRKSITLAAALAFALTLGVACSDDDSPGNGQKDTGATQKDLGAKIDGAATLDKGAVTPDQAAVTPDKGTTTADTGSTATCTGCHGFPPSTGKHAKHTAKGYKCATCHSEVIDSSNKIISATKHKNGSKDVKGSFTWDSSNKSCSAVGCHGTKSW